MKTNILKYLLISIVFIGFFNSCKKKYTSENLSSITYYPKFDMKGEAVVLQKKGTTYTDAAVTAAENGKDIPVTISVTGELTGYTGTEVDVNTPDKYTITYSAKNSDGYSGNVTRTVWVSESEDLTVGLAGLYKTSIVRGDNPAIGDFEYYMITKAGDNKYNLACAVGAYYYLGRAYGYDYAAQGSVVTVNNLATNDFTVSDGTFPLWGNTAVVSNFTVDATAGIITFTGTGNFTNGVFNVTLTKVEL